MRPCRALVTQTGARRAGARTCRFFFGFFFASYSIPDRTVLNHSFSIRIALSGSLFSSSRTYGGECVRVPGEERTRGQGECSIVRLVTLERGRAHRAPTLLPSCHSL